MRAPFVIMDIDGTLSNPSHRLHLLPSGSHEGKPVDTDWRAFFDAAAGDTPFPEIRILNNKMAETFPVFIVTGRSEDDRAATETWLRENDIRYDRLYMRPSGAHAPDTEIKKQILERLRAEGFEPLFAVEDRKSVTEMWRANGVRCLQVCEGNY